MMVNENAASHTAKYDADRKGRATKAHAISIYDLLDYGKENRRTSRELMQITGLDERSLRDAVRRERIAGKLIASTKENGGGYYIPKDKEEAADFVNAMSKEARSIFYMMKGARTAAKEDKDQ